jgi:hypothetical protein
LRRAWLHVFHFRLGGINSRGFMTWLCRHSQAGPLSVLSFDSFKRMCLARFNKEKELIMHHLPKGVGCLRCPTGAAIEAGMLTELPGNVSLIASNSISSPEHQRPKKKSKEVQMPSKDHKVVLPPGINAEMIKNQPLRSMTVLDLKPYWTQQPMLKAGEEGCCPNCNRQIKICAGGLCGGCYCASKKLSGKSLLARLARSAQELSVKIESPVNVNLNEEQIAKDEATPHQSENGNPDEESTTLESDKSPAVDSAVLAGYHPLFGVLIDALDQAQHGKGRERHANNLPFLEQPIMVEARSVGLGFPAGQARKKILEAVRCAGQEPNRAIADLLGAINYTAATILAIREFTRP